MLGKADIGLTAVHGYTFNIIPDLCSKLLQNIYSNTRTTIYGYIILLLHVSAYNGHLQEGVYQKKELLWLIILQML